MTINTFLSNEFKWKNAKALASLVFSLLASAIFMLYSYGDEEPNMLFFLAFMILFVFFQIGFWVTSAISADGNTGKKEVTNVAIVWGVLMALSLMFADYSELTLLEIVFDILITYFVTVTLHSLTLYLFAKETSDATV